MNKKTYTIAQLVEELRRSGFPDATKRKVRYFVEKGLMSGPEGVRGGARYDDGHLHRILAILKLWKRLRLPEIKRELDRMSPEQIRDLALQAEPEIAAMPFAEADEMLGQETFISKSPSFFPSLNYSCQFDEISSMAPSGEAWHRFTVHDGVELSVREDAVRHLSRVHPEMAGEIRSLLVRLSGSGEPAVDRRTPDSVSGPGFQSFECYRLNGHLFAEIGNHRALIDTGSPLSFGDCGTLSICGRDFRIPRELRLPGPPCTAEEFGRLIETDFSVLLGADALKELDVIVDLREDRISFADDIGVFSGDPVPLRLKGDLPVVSGRLGEGSFDFLVATGNKLSFLDSILSRNYPVAGRDTEFLPRMGEFEGGKFETDLRRAKIRLGRRTYALSFGQFPKAMEDFARVGLGIAGTLGADLLEKGPVGFSFRRKVLFI